MRKITLYIFLLIMVFTGLTSCEEEIPFKGTETRPMLALNSLITAGTAIQVNVTASRFFLNEGAEFKAVTNAEIVLYINNILKDTLDNRLNGNYLSEYKPVYGDKIKLIAKAEGYETVVAEDEVAALNTGFSIDTATEYKSIIPSYWEVRNDSTDKYETQVLGNQYDLIHHFRVNFTDPAGIKNYYRLVVSQTQTNYGELVYTSYKKDFDDIIFGNTNAMGESSDNNPYCIFSDELIDGKSYSFQFKIEQSYFKYVNPVRNPVEERAVHINLQPISQAYYLFLKSLHQVDQGDGFLSEPVQVYTNVKNGIGILGCISNQQKDVVILKP